ncbi:MAG: AAA family ATPase [Actinobacteria bacterium]|nr:AAA family ATPase [Actinomycetota bacterium]
MLVDRDALLARLLDTAAEGLAGRGRLLFLGGEAGVGKTALVRALAAELRDHSTVRIGAVDNLTTAEPLAAVIDALPELRIDDPDRLRLFRTLRGTLASAPSLLVLEDVHWADELTLDALRFLGRRLAGLPVLIVATYRHDEVSPRHPLTPLLGDLAGLPDVHRLVVPPLTPDGVAALVERSGLGIDAVGLHARTEGNAFFVTEVLAAGADNLPATVRDAVLARTARLSPHAAEVAAAAAVLATAVPAGLLTTVSGRGFDAVDECLERGVLTEGPAGITFRHELAREAVAASLSASQRRQLHRRALAVLTERDPSDHRALAHHAFGAGEDALAATHALAAGAYAARLGAHREAAVQYQLAARASPSGGQGPADRADLLVALAYECYLTDQLPEAIAAQVPWNCSNSSATAAASATASAGCRGCRGSSAVARTPSATAHAPSRHWSRSVTATNSPWPTRTSHTCACWPWTTLRPRSGGPEPSTSQSASATARSKSTRSTTSARRSTTPDAWPRGVNSWSAASNWPWRATPTSTWPGRTPTSATRRQPPVATGTP